jgi:ABC-type lipoprotein release transport system permease subunit
LREQRRTHGSADTDDTQPGLTHARHIVSGAIMLRSVMSTVVYGVQTLDPLAYTAACLLLCAATIAACAVPARRASRLDPAVALRSE